MTLTTELASGCDVASVGFGTYKVNERTGRNPRIAAGIQISAGKARAF